MQRDVVLELYRSHGILAGRDVDGPSSGGGARIDSRADRRGGIVLAFSGRAELSDVEKRARAR